MFVCDRGDSGRGVVVIVAVLGSDRTVSVLGDDWVRIGSDDDNECLLLRWIVKSISHNPLMESLSSLHCIGC